MEKRAYKLDYSQFDGIATDILGRGNSLSFYATGQSMLPFIQDGDGVVLDPISEIPRLGDVVLARTSAGTLIMHRVVKRGLTEITTRGDATNRADTPVQLEDILGRVSRVTGRGKNLHLKFPFRLMLVARPIAYEILKPFPGKHLLKQILAKLLS